MFFARQQRHPRYPADGEVTGASVVVVGAGPVGLAAAALLGRRGIGTLVLERHTEPYPLPRAVHVDDEVVRILQEIGVARAFTDVSRPMPGLRLLDGRHRVLAQFSRPEVLSGHGYPQANMFDQPDFERVLAARIAALPGVAVRRGATVTDLGVPAARGRPILVRWVDVDGSEHTTLADAVLGCDGANSRVRDLVRAGMRDLGFEERWLVLDVRSRRTLPVWGGVHQICDPRRAATFMHVVGDRYRWEFRLGPGESAADLDGPDQLAELLAPWRDVLHPAELDVVRRAEYTFRARVARHWRRGRVLLLGDAAHQMPPFIGQGLGAGLRDAHNLIWKLAMVLRGGADDALLDSYQAEREPHVVRTTRAAITVGWALTGGRGAAARLRRPLVRLSCRIPAVSAALLRTASPRLRLSGARRGRSGRLVGGLLPQPMVPAGRPGEPSGDRLDDLLGDGFALVVRGPVHRRTREAAGRSGVSVVDVSTTDTPDDTGAASTPGGAGPLPPPSGPGSRIRVAVPGLADWLARHRTYAVLVRPDRVVAAAFRRPTQVRFDAVPYFGARRRRRDR